MLNDLNTGVDNVTASVDFGNNQSFTMANLSINSSVLFLVMQNYSTGGDYVLNINATTPDGYDYESLPIKFGVRATGLSILSRNITERTFEFDVASDVIETLPNVTWSCSGNQSGPVVNLTGSLFDYFTTNFTGSGPQTFTCTATGADGTESKTITFTIQGLSLSSIDTLSTNVTQRVSLPHGMTGSQAMNLLKGGSAYCLFKNRPESRPARTLVEPRWMRNHRRIRRH